MQGNLHGEHDRCKPVLGGTHWNDALCPNGFVTRSGLGSLLA
jgi:hypothetical protein